MHILLISHFPPPRGGIGTWSERYMDYWEKHGAKQNVKVYPVNCNVIGSRIDAPYARRKILLEAKRSIQIVKNVLKQKKNGMDVVHLNSACSSFGIMRDYLCILAVGARIPVVFQCHCTVQDQLGNSKFSRFVFNRIMQRAACVLTLNQSSSEFIYSNFKTETKIVPNFLEGQIVLNRKKDIRESIKTAVYVGDIKERKGFFEIMSAAECFPEIQFRLVGCPAKEALAYPLPSNAVILGSRSREEVKRELDAADVFIFPSHTEGFSNAMAEAMARGLPIIASDVGANKDMIGSCGGMIVPKGDKQSLIRALHKISSPDIRRKMSDYNISTAREHFETEHVMEKLMSVYQMLLQ